MFSDVVLMANMTYIARKTLHITRNVTIINHREKENKIVQETYNIVLMHKFENIVNKSIHHGDWQSRNITKKTSIHLSRSMSLILFYLKKCSQICLYFLMDHEVLTTLQSGFISGDSTVNQLVDIYNSFCKAIDEGKEVRAIFCDFSKAFDRVWHKGLLYKLQTVGITGQLLQWFTDYLNNRKQRVVLQGVFSQGNGQKPTGTKAH